MFNFAYKSLFFIPSFRDTEPRYYRIIEVRVCIVAPLLLLCSFLEMRIFCLLSIQTLSFVPNFLLNLFYFMVK